MKQAIAGLAPAHLREGTVAVRWPGIGAYALGRLVGRLCGYYPAGDRFHLLAKLLAVATIPLALVLYFWRVMPVVARRFRLTNQRVIVQRGLVPTDEQWIGLGEFDEIQIEVLPGHEFLHAGDVVFRRVGLEVLRLPGVPRPIPFRAACLKARQALLSVGELLRPQAAPEPSVPVSP